MRERTPRRCPPVLRVFFLGFVEALEGRGPEALPGSAVSGTGEGEVAELIDPDALWDQYDAGGAPLVLDVRGSEEYAAGHLPSARHIPGEELAGRLDELPRDRLVVTYCTMRHRGDSRSERAAALLRERGYMARTLDGGLPAWEAAGLPIERGH